MPGISATIAQLRKLRSLSTDNAAHKAASRLNWFDDFGSNPGALNAYAYVPPKILQKASGQIPLVVVLHGCTQTAAAYDHSTGWGHLADAGGFAVLLPEQQRQNNPNLCFNWFAPGDLTRGSGEALSIKQMIDTMILRYNVDPARVYITGLSAGGAMASVMLATYPEMFAGGAIVAGLPYGSATSIPEALARMRGQDMPSEPDLQSLLRAASAHQGKWPTISVWHGSADHVVAKVNSDAIVAQWRNVHDVAVAATRSDMVEGCPHSVWVDASGRDVIESFTITGMGHGTPLRVGDADDIEMTGPFMLDAGISASRHSAEFWGLIEKSERHPTSRQITARVGPSIRIQNPKPQMPPATGIRKTIEDALRSAGLMR